MGTNLARKILSEHLVSGKLEPGEEISIRIDQTLTQDATGTMAYLQFEAMGIPRVKTELSVSYVDHNTLQTGFENADDHQFLQSIAAKYGIYFSRPGNGICHQVHLERFGAPGKTLLGSDSHTPTGGGLGMIAIGAGGLDVAVAMGGGPFVTTMPQILNVRLTGTLPPWVTAKDIILEVLRRRTVKGGVGKIVEYTGPGIKSLNVPARSTITNMGAELGATTSIFPSDDVTHSYLKAQGRESAYREMGPDENAAYDDVEEINLDDMVPLIAKPHSPDNVCTAAELKGTPVVQVAIGSCTNSSFSDLMAVANILREKTVHPRVSLAISPGSRQVFEMTSRNGALADLISAGARILESACGPCIGMGQAPPTEGASIRSFNRNFKGRSGTASGQVYLASPEVCAASAITGEITDPRELGDYERVELPEEFLIDDRMIIAPPAADEAEKIQIIRGPNIKPVPVQKPLPGDLSGEVLLKVEDNITTDHIMPAGAKILPLRSNIPAMSEYVYAGVDPEFPSRAKEKGGGFIVGGDNYGQGSSREHAALVPMYLGLRGVIARSFARIHRANLINFGIVPLVFDDPTQYDGIAQGDVLKIEGLHERLAVDKPVAVRNETKGLDIICRHNLSERQIDIIKAGGLLNYTKAGVS
ncbi:MAG: aconitate hydratase [Candidatus Latescibacteria bacterium]|nr:aconitate hydratase [Candidatus Latescibacterota bacterium]NIM21962.1 aconitate hydratase [Candidatus Latescibacterota bacterium]NIM65980.1 aconitate hydratase [Candidatus Latescibacterota bacterium]NIO02388.1 aconitate hydratase [Candidatus Latescibacterota bacterium]NIO29298.1 aconitate hydratase [Candidatus Latescibacterota bacterium]